MLDNISEAKTYARDLLELKGYNVTEQDVRGEYVFWVSVLGDRIDGTCVGFITLELFKYVELDGQRGRFVVAENGHLSGRNTNVNPVVLDRIKELSEDL